MGRATVFNLKTRHRLSMSSWGQKRFLIAPKHVFRSYPEQRIVRRPVVPVREEAVPPQLVFWGFSPAATAVIRRMMVALIYSNSRMFQSGFPLLQLAF